MDLRPHLKAMRAIKKNQKKNPTTSELDFGIESRKKTSNLNKSNEIVKQDWDRWKNVIHKRKLKSKCEMFQTLVISFNQLCLIIFLISFKHKLKMSVSKDVKCFFLMSFYGEVYFQ